MIGTKPSIRSRVLNSDVLREVLRRSSQKYTQPQPQPTRSNIRNYVIRNTSNDIRRPHSRYTRSSNPTLAQYTHKPSNNSILMGTSDLFGTRELEERSSYNHSKGEYTNTRDDEREQKEQERRRHIEREKQRLEGERQTRYKERDKIKGEIRVRRNQQSKEQEYLREVERIKKDERLRKNKDFKPLGLKNIGNTCYMNSILQSLMNLPSFNEFFLSGGYSTATKPTVRVSDNYSQLLSQMQTKTGVKTPSALKSAVCSKNIQFAGFKQQDANEFLTCLLTLMGEELKQQHQVLLSMNPVPQSVKEKSEAQWQEHLSREDSHISNYFCGQLITLILCGNCQKSVESLDCFYDIQLNFRKPSQTLEEMLIDYVREEPLSDYKCSSCHVIGKCFKRVRISRLPLVLVLNMKRFQFSRKTPQKLKNTVILDREMNLSRYLHPEIQLSRQCMYVLGGLVKHYGEVNYGHYTAECWNYISERWFQFDDEKVQEIRISDTIHSTEAYVVFYVDKILLCLFTSYQLFVTTCNYYSPPLPLFIPAPPLHHTISVSHLAPQSLKTPTLALLSTRACIMYPDSLTSATVPWGCEGSLTSNRLSEVLGSYFSLGEVTTYPVAVAFKQSQPSCWNNTGWKLTSPIYYVVIEEIRYNSYLQE